MNQYVTDTHALYWYISGSARLGSGAKGAFDEAAAGGAMIIVPAIVIAELFYLNEKLGRPLDFANEFDFIRDSGQFTLAPLSPQDVLDFALDGRVSEMHDRIIVGVSRRFGATCITRDVEITSRGNISTVW